MQLDLTVYTSGIEILAGRTDKEAWIARETNRFLRNH